MSTIPAVTCNTDWTLVYDSFLAGDFIGSLQTSGLSYFCVSATPPLTSQSGVNAGGDVEQIKLEGSDDNGATFYAIGAALLGVASSTVQVTVAGISAQLLRARVSVIGNTVTAGYVLIKGF
jgi:hypothetical protein